MDFDFCKRIFGNASIGIFMVDVENGQIDMVNSFGCMMFDYEEKELIGQNLKTLFTKDTKIDLQENLLSVTNNYSQGISSAIGIKKDGTVMSIEIEHSPIALSNKKYIVAFINDIDNRIKAELALIENEARLSAIIDSAIDGIISINSRGIIQTINKATNRLFDYEEDELIGQNISILMPEPWHSNHDKYIENYKKTGHKKIMGIGREVQGLRKDGTQFPLYISISEAIVENKRIFTGILHDLSDRIKAEKAELDRSKWLEEYAEKLEKEVADRTSELRKSELKLRSSLSRERELNDLKSRFVSMASHEFRTPLSTVLSSTELVEMFLEVDNKDKVHKNLQRIKKSVDNLNAILNDFLSLEKLETGKTNYNPQPISLSAFVDDLIDEAKLHKKESQSIKTEIKGEDQFMADPFLLKNIMLNLLSNAVKYSLDDSVIQLLINNESEDLKIEVIDQGIGIPDDDKKNMFSRFFRASNVENIQGTGLGLTIVKRYLDLMSGTIDFSSEMNVGTTFTLSIPKKKVNHDT